MAVYNGEKYLAAAVRSIRAQSYTDFELIVVNDGSTDQTENILREIPDPRIRVITNPKNLGLPKSLNIGITEAKGEFIARQDADDLSDPRRFEKQIEYLTAHRHVGLLGTWCKKMFGEELQDKVIKIRAPTYKNLSDGNQIVHGSVMMRTAIVKQVGGYDSFFSAAQDYDLWVRLAKITELANLPEVLYILRVHDNTVSAKPNTRQRLSTLFISHQAQGKIDSATIAKVRADGVESYFDYLPAADKAKVHNGLGKQHKIINNYPQAIKEYRQAIKYYKLAQVADGFSLTIAAKKIRTQVKYLLLRLTS